jgi:uncharacterized protein YbjT (DUF2867 family)
MVKAMTKVLILGANGQIARVATEMFLERPDVELTLYLRHANRLSALAGHERVRIVEGDVLDAHALEGAMSGQHVVYANLGGRMEEQAKLIVRTMDKLGMKRLIFISSMGIYHEAKGQAFGSALNPYRKAADVIEQSDLDYSILRPAWLNDRDEIDYGTTQKGQPFTNPNGVVSRKSVADLVVKLALTPGLEVRRNLGVHKG